jgi:hypothetical protein
MKPTKIIVILLIMTGFHVLAQRSLPEFSIYGNGGIPLLLPKGTPSPTGFNSEGGLGFTAFFSQQIGIHFGVGFGSYNIETKVDVFNTFTPELIDRNDLVFDLYTTLSDYKEFQKATFFSIPIMLQFQSNRTHSFYAMGGAKLQLLHQTSYESSIATFHNAAFYHYYNNWATTQTFAGLGTFKGTTTTGKFNYDLLTALSLETGMKWRIGSVFLYTGVYLDYTLNNPAENHRKPLGDFIMPDQLPNLTLLTFADKIIPITAGIKLRLALPRALGKQPNLTISGRVHPGMVPSPGQ